MNCDFGLIIEQVTYLVDLAKDIPGFRSNKGYCVVKSAEDGQLLLAFQVGEFSADEAENCYSLANQQADFSHQHILDHTSCCGTFDNGTVSIGNKFIFSFSGEKNMRANEAIMLWTAIMCGLIRESDAQLIALDNGNMPFGRLTKRLGVRMGL